MNRSNRNKSGIFSNIFIIRQLAMTAVMIMLISAMPPCSTESYAAVEEPVSAINASQEPAQEGVIGGAFEVTSYDCIATVNKDHSYVVEELITVDIPDTLQKIDFAVPSGNFRLTGLEVEDTAYAANKASEASTISIVDPDKLTTGLHTYKIRYRIMEFADRDENEDILYFNVLLPEWKQPIANVSINVELPDDFPMDTVQVFSGQLGVQDDENRLTVSTSARNHTIDISGKMIPENFGISVKASLPDGYWEGALNGIWAAFAMVVTMGSVVLILYVLWMIGGRDPKIRKTPETKPVSGVSPVELGYIFNGRTDIRDIVRLILYFGTKGYLRISEYEPKRYRLYRMKDPDGEERLLRNAYNILFEDVYKGRALEMDQLGSRLARIEDTIGDDIAAGFSSREMLAYTPVSRAFRTAGIILCAAGVAVTNALKYSYQYLPVNYAESIITGLIAGGLIFLICIADDRKYMSAGDSGRTGEIITSAALGFLAVYLSVSIVRQTGQYPAALLVAAFIALAAFFAVIMRARGKGNAALVMKFRQLRKFIYNPVPAELLANHLADRNYYYDMMMYALTFGAEEAWAISFLTLDVPECSWFTDDIEGHAFSNLREQTTTLDFAHDLKSFVRTVETAYNEM